MRLAGRKDWGGADSEQLSRALTQIQTTLIRTNFKDRAGRYIEERFPYFFQDAELNAGGSLPATRLRLAPLLLLIRLSRSLQERTLLLVSIMR